MRDFLGQEIEEGDVIVHPTRKADTVVVGLYGILRFETWQKGYHEVDVAIVLFRDGEKYKATALSKTGKSVRVEAVDTNEEIWELKRYIRIANAQGLRPGQSIPRTAD